MNKEKWSKPELSKLGVEDTKMSPNATEHQDASYIDPNGNLWISRS